jgi:hypothetical protein
LKSNLIEADLDKQAKRFKPNNHISQNKEDDNAEIYNEKYDNQNFVSDVIFGSISISPKCQR